MPTTFTVFSLGTVTNPSTGSLVDIDPIDGNTLAENAGLLVGQTFGGVGNALLNQAVTMSPGSGGFGGGTSDAYDQDNTPNESFRINGGPGQVFDAAAVYNATITYVDGTTASISAVVFQDTAGNLYFAPELTANSDQAALEAGGIRSLTLDSLNGASFSGLSGNRVVWDFVTCYVAGTRIATEDGDRPIEQLQVGDRVFTRDHGLQPIRWIGNSTVRAVGKLAPVRFTQGALGQNAPERDLLVSRQHRMLVSSAVCERMFGSTEILVPAIKLTALQGVFVEEQAAPLTYYHLMTDQHDIIYAEGVPSETMLSGPQAMDVLSDVALAELVAIFPDIHKEIPQPARAIERGKRIDRLILRHKQHNIPFSATRT